MNTFNLKVISPDGIKFNQEVVSFETTTVRGRIGIYANHVNLVASLKPNVFKIRLKNNKIEEYIINSGYLFFENNSAKIIANFFDDVNNVSAAKINENINELKQKLAKIDENHPSYKMLNFQIKKFEDILKIINK